MNIVQKIWPFTRRSTADALATTLAKVQAELVDARNTAARNEEMYVNECRQHAATREAHRTEMARKNRALASILAWVRVTHGVDKIPAVGSIRDLLQEVR